MQGYNVPYSVVRYNFKLPPTSGGAAAEVCNQNPPKVKKGSGAFESSSGFVILPLGSSVDRLFLCVWTSVLCSVRDRGHRRHRRHTLLSTLMVHSCRRYSNPTCPATRCLSAGFPSIAPVGMGMLELWCPCYSSFRTRLIWLLRTPASDGPLCTGLLTTDRWTRSLCE